MNLTIHPLTADLWPVRVDRFGKSGYVVVIELHEPE